MIETKPAVNLGLREKIWVEEEVAQGFVATGDAVVKVSTRSELWKASRRRW